jgi:peptidoglycan/xylan/chitin deacetylase (PgdA/CDA1 family)
MGLGHLVRAGMGILMYHRVAPLPEGGGAQAPTWNVTPSRLRQQLGGLIERGYRPWPLRRALEHSREGLPLPSTAFVVTFDDGYESVYRYAWPILRALQVPATVFLATAYLDSAEPFPFDDWAESGSRRVPEGSWRPLRKAQCREMLADGLVELGAHTHTHQDFRGHAADFEKDLARCVSELREGFGVIEVTFAFPFGTPSAGFAQQDLVAAAKRTGVICGLTTETTRVRAGSDPFTWGRFEVLDADTAGTISRCLDGSYDVMREAWGRLCGGRGSDART